MRKLTIRALLVLLSVVMLCILIPFTAVSATEETVSTEPIYLFDRNTIIPSIGGNFDFETIDAVYNSDPYFHRFTSGTSTNVNGDGERVYISLDKTLYADGHTVADAPVVKVGYRTNSTRSSAGFNVAFWNGKSNTRTWSKIGFPMTSGGWKSSTVDLSAQHWYGGLNTSTYPDLAASWAHWSPMQLGYIMYRPFNTPSATVYFDVLYVAMFETVEDANAWEYTMPTYDWQDFAVDATEGGSFTVNGGDSSTAYSTKHYIGQKITLTAIDQNKYDFIGWYDSESNLVSSAATYEFTMTETPVDLTAKFEAVPYATFKIDGEIIAEVEYDENGGLVYPDIVPTKPGYGFSAWGNADGPVAEGTTLTELVELTPVFKAPTALYDASNYLSINGGTNLPYGYMTDPETGNDYVHIYESVTEAYTSVDGDKPQFKFDTTAQPHDILEDSYMAFGVRTNINRTSSLNININGGVFWGVTFVPTADGTWQHRVVDLTKFSGGNKKPVTDYLYGAMTGMYIRPHGAASIAINDGDYYDVMYMALFDDETAANNFVYAGNEVEKDTFSVTFYDADGSILKTETVKSGYKTITPEVTAPENKIYVGWQNKSTGAVEAFGNTPVVVSADTEYVPVFKADIIGTGAYEKYITDRADLANVYNKLTVDNELTVAYFGGSVTAGAGASNSELYSWRALTHRMLKKEYPNATVTMVNAAIGGRYRTEPRSCIH